MNTEQAELFFSILTVAVLVGTAALLVCVAGARRFASPGRLVDAIRPFTIPLAAAVAATCMAGSLYFSEVAGFLPCTLCWYQRIAMYSLAVILGLAAVRRDPTIRRYALPLAGIGILISTYHWLLERFPSIDAGACSATVPCEFVWFEQFGFVTLPFMAFTGFAAVITLLAISPTPLLAPGGTS
jgi:disulfide bond formation protein DsbB